MSGADYYEYERKLKYYENERGRLLKEYADFAERRVSISLQLGALRNAKEVLLKKRAREEKR